MRRRKEDGQYTVEFALVLPILILLIFGMLDFGWLFYNKIEVNNASREGARYAVIHCGTADYRNADTDSAYDPNGPGVSPDPPHILTKLHVLNYAPGAEVEVMETSETISVNVKKEIRVLTGVMTMFLGNTVELESTCTMRIE